MGTGRRGEALVDAVEAAEEVWSGSCGFLVVPSEVPSRSEVKTVVIGRHLVPGLRLVMITKHNQTGPLLYIRGVSIYRTFL